MSIGGYGEVSVNQKDDFWVLGSISSEAKFEGICNALIDTDSSVNDSTHLFSWMHLAERGKYTQVTVDPGDLLRSFFHSATKETLYNDCEDHRSVSLTK